MGYDDGFLTFSTKMGRKSGRTCARVNENEWWALTNRVWDLTYKPDELKIWHEQYDIGLHITYDSDEDLVRIRGSFYNNGLHVEATENKLKLGSNIIKGSTITDTQVGIAFGASNS